MKNYLLLLVVVVFTQSSFATLTPDAYAHATRVVSPPPSRGGGGGGGVVVPTQILPTIALNWISGSNPLLGQHLEIGKKSVIQVVVTNPWTNSTVAMGVTNKSLGMRIVQVSANVWTFEWTPDQSEVGTTTVGLVATFTQGDGASTPLPATFDAIVDPLALTTLSTVNSLTVKSAVLSKKTLKLKISGKLSVQSGYSLPEGTYVAISSNSGVNLIDGGVKIDSFKKNGAWSTTVVLKQGNVPCNVKAVLVLPPPYVTTSSFIASKVVAGSSAGCIQ